jgi:hypothetical protein
MLHVRQGSDSSVSAGAELSTGDLKVTPPGLVRRELGCRWGLVTSRQITAAPGRGCIGQETLLAGLVIRWRGEACQEEQQAGGAGPLLWAAAGWESLLLGPAACGRGRLLLGSCCRLLSYVARLHCRPRQRGCSSGCGLPLCWDGCLLGDCATGGRGRRHAVRARAANASLRVGCIGGSGFGTFGSRSEYLLRLAA